MGRNLVVVVERVVEHLVFETQRGVVRRILQRKLLGDVVFDAAIRAGRGFPVEREFEIAERVDGHEVAAGRRLPIGHEGNLAAGNFHDRAVYHLPMRRRHAALAKSAPARKRLAVEEKAPAGGPLGWRERVLCIGRERRYEQETQRGDDTHAATPRLRWLGLYGALDGRQLGDTRQADLFAGLETIVKGYFRKNPNG